MWIWSFFNWTQETENRSLLVFCAMWLGFSISGPFRTCAYLPSLVIAFYWRCFSLSFRHFFSSFCPPLVLSLCFLILPIFSVLSSGRISSLCSSMHMTKMRSLLFFQFLRSISIKIKMHKDLLGCWFSVATTNAVAHHRTSKHLLRLASTLSTRN